MKLPKFISRVLRALPRLGGRPGGGMGGGRPGGGMGGGRPGGPGREPVPGRGPGEGRPGGPGRDPGHDPGHDPFPGPGRDPGHDPGRGPGRGPGHWPAPIGWGGHGWGDDHPWRWGQWWRMPIWDGGFYTLAGANLGDPTSMQNDYIYPMAQEYGLTVVSVSVGQSPDGASVVYWTVRGGDYAIEAFAEQLNAVFTPYSVL